MARALRVEYPGAFYHVMARGNRRESIFRDEGDRRFLCQTLAEACARTGWKVHAWVLMSNHYHLMFGDGAMCRYGGGAASFRGPIFNQSRYVD